MNAANLDVVLVCNGLKLFLLLRELGQFDVDGSSEGSAQVGGARGDVAKVVIMAELGHCLNVGCSPAEPFKDSCNVCSLLHRDDPKLVLFVHPHKEGFVSVVVYPTSTWPIPVTATSFKETISFPAEN